MENIKLLYIDLFCGAGGTTTGVENAKLHGEKCANVIACVNHDPVAIASHLANHPEAVHFTEDIRTLEMSPLERIAEESRKKYPDAKLVIWASLECTNFSKAKGGMPRDADSRTLANHLFRYIEALKPDYIQIENVEEFMSWGELDENGKPIDKLNGSDYLKWCNRVKSHGYSYSYRILNSADFGAYTSRKRFFGLFAKLGMSRAFPLPTFSKTGGNGGGLFDIGMNRWKPVKDVLDLDVYSFKELKYDEIKPIPITPEILEKNGFVKRSERDDKLGKMEYYQFDDYGFIYHYSNGEWEFKLQNTQVYRLFIGYLNNVNELQHVLNILNIDKEIKL